MGLMDNFQFRDPYYQDPAMERVWLTLMCRPKRQRAPRSSQAARDPQMMAWSPAHTCRHAWLHRLLILTVCGAWLAWSVPCTLYVGPWLARRLFAPNNPLQLLPIGLAWLPWLFGVIPVVTGVLWGMTLGNCGSVPHVPSPPRPQAPMVPGQPVLIERVLLTPEDAARRGLPGPVIVERIHYGREG